MKKIKQLIEEKKNILAYEIIKAIILCDDDVISKKICNNILDSIDDIEFTDKEIEKIIEFLDK